MIARLTGLPGWLRSAIAVIPGVVTALGYAPLGWWPCTLAGLVGLILLAVTAPRARDALGTGLFWGLGFLGVSIRWMSVIFVEAMLGLVGMEALFYAVFAWALWLVRSVRPWPLLGAGLWLATEYAFSHVPFDGFGWMRLAYALIDTPLAGFLPLLGVPGVSLLGALLAHALAWVPLQVRVRRRTWTTGGAVLGLVLIVGMAGRFWPAGPATGRVNVGYVQGNAPGGGIYGLGEARTITRNHVAETKRLAAAVAAGTAARPDFVVWPENGTDGDPFLDAETTRLVDRARAAAGVPLLIGSITLGPGANQRQTAILWYDPATGVTGRYDKRNIVPFGEWVPYREILEPLFPVVAYVGPQSVPGTGPGVLDVAVAAGAIKVATLVCYEVAYDTTVHDTVTGGGEVVLVQSSNAMFTGTDQVYQQFAITRARAAELRREILVVTTTGISGLIGPDGTVAFTLPEHVPASGVVTLPRRTGLTPAVTFGGPLELVVVIGALAWLAGALLAQRRGR